MYLKIEGTEAGVPAAYQTVTQTDESSAQTAKSAQEELDENSRLVIYPCINTVLLGDDIRELLETFSEEEDSGDKTGVQSALENLPE